jgi:hypothetical protein
MRRPIWGSSIIAIATAVLSSSQVAFSDGLPIGRAWTPATTLIEPGYGYLAAPRLERDTTGTPELFAISPWNPGASNSAFGFRWADSTWRRVWRLDQDTGALWPVTSPPGLTYLVWSRIAGLYDERTPMYMARVVGDSVWAADSVTDVSWGVTEYAGAATARRRWLLVEDRGLYPLPDSLRLHYSDGTLPYSQIPLHAPTQNEGQTILAIDDTTVMAAWAAGWDIGVKWGIARGDHWQEGPRIYERWSGSPRLRPRPSGGQWLVWSTHDAHVRISWFDGTSWAEPESIGCAYLNGNPTHGGFTPELSRDGDEYEYPVVVWDSQDFGGNFNLCVCIPSDSGFGHAIELEEGLNGGRPSVIRDRNGDVWIAWWMTNYVGGTRWLHSYTTATTDTPQVAAAGRVRQVRWSLSTPAPRSWWAVERADGDGEFAQVGRVRAGPDSLIAWTDTTAPAGVVRYRIRRECVDKRYEWLSAESRWPAHGLGPRVLRVSANPAATQVSFEVVDAAAGALEVRLHDLQGRVVWRERRTSAGSGRDAFTVDVPHEGGRIRPGIYFLRARDALGHESETAKVAVLR